MSIAFELEHSIVYVHSEIYKNNMYKTVNRVGKLCKLYLLVNNHD